MEKVLWLIKHVKSGLRSFVLEISCWMMLHGREDQLKLIGIKLRHWEQSTLYHAGDRWHTQNIQIEHWKFAPAWLRDAWVPRKLSKQNLDHISACNSLLKRNENIPGFFCLFSLFYFLFIICFYLFMAALGLRCCTRAFSSCGKRELLFVAVHGL